MSDPRAEPEDVANAVVLLAEVMLAAILATERVVDGYDGPEDGQRYAFLSGLYVHVRDAMQAQPAEIRDQWRAVHRRHFDDGVTSREIFDAFDELVRRSLPHRVSR